MAAAELPVVSLSLGSCRALLNPHTGSWVATVEGTHDHATVADVASLRATLASFESGLSDVRSLASSAEAEKLASERRADVLLSMLAEEQARRAALESELERERLHTEALRWWVVDFSCRVRVCSCHDYRRC